MWRNAGSLLAALDALATNRKMRRHLFVLSELLFDVPDPSSHCGTVAHFYRHHHNGAVEEGVAKRPAARPAPARARAKAVCPAPLPPLVWQDTLIAVLSTPTATPTTADFKCLA